MNFKSVTVFLLALLLIFGAAFAYLQDVTTPDKIGNTPEGVPPSSPSGGTGLLLVNPKTDVHLRECAGTACPAIAILEKGSVVRPTGKTASVENSQGALMPWQEVTFQSGRFCAPSSTPQSECLQWMDAPAPTGWVSAAHLRTNH